MPTGPGGGGGPCGYQRHQSDQRAVTLLASTLQCMWTVPMGISMNALTSPYVYNGQAQEHLRCERTFSLASDRTPYMGTFSTLRTR